MLTVFSEIIISYWETDLQLRDVKDCDKHHCFGTYEKQSNWTKENFENLHNRLCPWKIQECRIYQIYKFLCFYHFSSEPRLYRVQEDSAMNCHRKWLIVCQSINIFMCFQ